MFGTFSPRDWSSLRRAGPYQVLFSAVGVTGIYTMRDARADPVEPRMTLDDRESPAAPGGEAEGEQRETALWDRAMGPETPGPLLRP